MSLPIHDLSVSGFELIFSMTTELSKSFTIVLNRDLSSTEYSYDPVTRTYPDLAEKETELVLNDCRYIKYKPQEILNSSGTLTTSSRKVYIRYADLLGIGISEVDQGLLPDGSTVEIKSVKYVPEVNPVFVVLQIEGVNDAISINS